MSMLNRIRKFFGGGVPESEPTDGESAAMISCEDALRLVNEFIDGELEAVSTAEVEQHFEMCQRCYPHLHLEKAFREALRSAASGASAPEDLRTRLTTMIAEERAGE